MSLKDKAVGFLGAGNMGEAMIKGMVAQGVVTPNQIMASDPVAARREQMTSNFGVRATDTNLTAVQEADVIVLSVKPQILPKVMAELNGKISASALILSIVAGVPIALPALTRALKLQQKAGSVGFDWNDPQAVLAKIREETDEIAEEIAASDQQKAAAEKFGSLLRPNS